MCQKRVCLTAVTAMCIVSLASLASAGDIIWDFENGNDHGFALKSVVPPVPAPDNPDKAGDESKTGGLPGAGIAWTICDLSAFEGLLPAVIEGNNIVNGRLVYQNSLPKPKGPSQLGQNGYLNTYAIDMWGDNLHTAANDQIASSPLVELGTGSVLTIHAIGGMDGYIAPALDPDPTKGYVDKSCGVAVLDKNGALLLSKYMPSRNWAVYDIDLSAFAGQQVTIDIVDAFAGGFGWIAIDQIKITNATLAGVAGLAKSPSPANEATDVRFDTMLFWTAGEFAKTHDVYLGTSFEDVNAAGRTNPMNVLVSQGQSGTTYDAANALTFGQTYFWRIDEVNAAPDNTIFKGKVWSFTTEPYAYPIKTVIATASSAQPGMGPENTVNGSGLKDDEHSTDLMQMWMSAATQPHWIQYEFDGIYKLDELRVWNSNAPMEAFTGFGAKNVTIEYSTDGAAWTALEGVPQFNQATGTPTYTASTFVDFHGVMAKFVKLTITSTWGAAPTSLSEVRFFSVPVQARAPQPAADAKSAAVDSVLGWRPGREAVAHKVFFGTDQQAVIGGTAPAEVVAGTSFAPGLLTYGQTYYWRVDEVNEAATPSTWEGDVWSFSTADYAVIDNFEGYTNASPNRLFQAWIDGLGFSEDAFFPKGNAGNGTGAMVGHDPMQGDIVEKTIVKSGRQSMPLFYDNTSAATSEAQYTLPAQDWTASGIKSLSLYFYGDPGNAGQLYVKINNTKVSYNGGAADIKAKQWQPWNIDLATVGTSVKNVTKLTIGVEGAAATGVLYIDDIRLYPRTPEFAIPVDPGKTGLLAEYLFDNGANDTSGKNHHGTFLDNAHVANSVLVLDGVNDAVAIPRLGGATATFKQCTYSMWMYSVSSLAAAGPVGGINFDNWSAGGIHCKLYNGKANAGINGLSGGDMNGTTIVGAGEWVHLALTVSDTVATLYLNGRAEASRTFSTPLTMILGSGSIGAWSTNGDIQRELKGQMDDVRVYDRALSAEELLWLAGKKDPMHKPF